MKKFLILALLLIIPSMALPDLEAQLKGDAMVRDGGAPWFGDNAIMYFGADKDGYIKYNSTSGYVELSGVASDVLTNGGAVGSGNDITFAGGDSVFNAGSASGAFTTSTGTNTLSGDTVIAGSKTFTTGTGAIALNGDVTIAATKGITKTTGAGNFDFSAGSGTFLTSTGTNTLGGNVVIAGSKTFSTGTGAITLSGPVGIASGVDVTAAGGESDLDYSLSGGFFKTPTGTMTLNGAVSVGSGIDIVAAGGASDISYGSSSGVFTSPTGTNTLSGAVTVAANKGITAASGTGAFNFGGASGIFTTSTGANTLSGDVTISGSKAFTTGTGAVRLQGETSIASGKTFTVGPTIHQTNTSAVNITITDTGPDFWFCGNSTDVNTQTYTLPTAADNTGRILTFILSTNPGTNSVILDGEGAETVAGHATLICTDAAGSMYQLICDGSAWWEVTHIGTWTNT